MSRRRIIFSSLLRPAVLAVGAFISLVGNIQTILIPVSPQLLEDAMANPFIGGVILTLSRFWYWILLAWVLIAIFEGLYQIAKPYIGERIAANITLKPDNRRDDKDIYRAWLVVDNQEQLELTDVIVETKAFAIDIGDNIWMDFTKFMNPSPPANLDCKTVIPAKSKNVHVNIARAVGERVSILFEDGKEEFAPQIPMYIDVAFHAKLNEEPIEIVRFTGLIESEPIVINPPGSVVGLEITQEEGVLPTGEVGNVTKKISLPKPEDIVIDEFLAVGITPCEPKDLAPFRDPGRNIVIEMKPN